MTVNSGDCGNMVEKIDIKSILENTEYTQTLKPSALDNIISLYNDTVDIANKSLTMLNTQDKRAIALERSINNINIILNGIPYQATIQDQKNKIQLVIILMKSVKGDTLFTYKDAFAEKKYKHICELLEYTQKELAAGKHLIYQSDKLGYSELLTNIDRFIADSNKQQLINFIGQVNNRNFDIILNNINNILGTEYSKSLLVIMITCMTYQLGLNLDLNKILVQEKEEFIQEFSNIISYEQKQYLKNVKHITSLVNCYLIAVIKFTGKNLYNRWPAVDIATDIYNNTKDFSLNKGTISKLNMLGMKEYNGINLSNAINIELIKRVVYRYKEV